MSDIDREERIRQRAHEIWERNGRREGSHEADWDQARREIEMEDEDGANLSETLTETMGLAVGAAPEESLEDNPSDAQQLAAAVSERPATGRRPARKKK